MITKQQINNIIRLTKQKGFYYFVYDKNLSVNDKRKIFKRIFEEMF